MRMTRRMEPPLAAPRAVAGDVRHRMQQSRGTVRLTESSTGRARETILVERRVREGGGVVGLDEVGKLVSRALGEERIEIFDWGLSRTSSLERNRAGLW